MGIKKPEKERRNARWSRRRTAPNSPEGAPSRWRWCSERGKKPVPWQASRPAAWPLTCAGLIGWQRCGGALSWGIGPLAATTGIFANESGPISAAKSAAW